MSDDEIRDMIRTANEHGLLLVKASVVVPLCEEVLRLRLEVATLRHFGVKNADAVLPLVKTYREAMADEERT